MASSLCEITLQPNLSTPLASRILSTSLTVVSKTVLSDGVTGTPSSYLNTCSRIHSGSPSLSGSTTLMVCLPMLHGVPNTSDAVLTSTSQAAAS